jgi:hypothetical protein
LFRRGQNEEAQVVADLRKAGLDVRFSGWDQKRVDFGSHVSGSMDGVIVSGVPEAPEKLHTLEIKTHSKKSFDDLERHGVEKSKPLHWAQCQGYMLGTFLPSFIEENGFGKIDRCLYVAICKDDDRIYTERIRLDKPKAEAIIERGKRIAIADRMPPPISTDSSWYECKMCFAHEFCFSTKKTKEKNCRTCSHSTSESDSTWSCVLHGKNIPVDFQRVGCRSHVLHPDLVPFLMLDGVGNSARYEMDGVQIVNGEDGIDSRELVGPSDIVKVEKSEEVVEWPLKQV